MSTAASFDHAKDIVKLLQHSGRHHDRFQVFSDCMAVMAITISNVLDRIAGPEREQRYLQIVGRYDRDEIDVFARVMSHLALALEQSPSDVLGRVLHAMETHDKSRGQFVTPHEVSLLMARLLAHDMGERLKEHDFVTVLEPAVGSGSTIIALAQSLQESGINYQQRLHVTAVNVDERAAHMAYAQFALMHLPAIVHVGDSLTGDIRDTWYTPAHILGGWERKLRAHPGSSDPSLR